MTSRVFDPSQQIQCIGMIRDCLEDFSIDGLRRIESARAVVFHRQSHPVLDAHLSHDRNRNRCALARTPPRARVMVILRRRMTDLATTTNTASSPRSAVNRRSVLLGLAAVIFMAALA